MVEQGRVVVEGRNKVVQHRDGGTVAEIAVSDGDRVEKGQMLMRLDPTEIAGSLEVARERLAGALALRARLRAERDGATTLAAGLPEDAPDVSPETRALYDSELEAQREILSARADVLANGQDRLTETLARLDEQETGLTARIDAMDEELGYLDEEIASVEPLFDQGLARREQISQLRRTRAERRGTLANLRAEKSRLSVSRREARLETAKAERSFHEQVVTDLQETSATISELEVKIATLTDQLDRVEVRAPASGVVHEMQVTTEGGVVQPGGTIMEIVPQDRDPGVEVRVAPQSIDDVRPGQEAELVLSSYDAETVPRLGGEVSRISAAAVQDPETGREFYRVEVAPAPGAFEEAGVRPVPGMPVEVYLTTGEQTVLSYLMEPVTGQLRKAFRE